MKRLMRVALAAAVFGMANGVWAQPNEPTAEQIRMAAAEFDEGKAAFKSGDYVEAAEHFEKADANAPSAAAIELAIRSRDRAGQLDRAATLAALAAARHTDKEPLQQFARTVLERAARELHKAAVSCDTPCDLAVDTKIVHGPPAAERVVYLSQGPHVLKAGWPEGRSATERVSATAGGDSAISFNEPPTTAPAEEDPDPVSEGGTDPFEADPAGDAGVEDAPKSGWSPAVFWVGLGLTGVATVVTAWSGIDTVNSPGVDAVQDQCVNQGESCELYQEGRSKQARTNVLLGVTAGLGVATIIIGAFATDWSGDKPAELEAAGKRMRRVSVGSLQVEPWVEIGSGATLGASGRF
jgi:hypothetical protein